MLLQQESVNLCHQQRYSLPSLLFSRLTCKDWDPLSGQVWNISLVLQSNSDKSISLSVQQSKSSFIKHHHALWFRLRALIYVDAFANRLTIGIASCLSDNRWFCIPVSSVRLSFTVQLFHHRESFPIRSDVLPLPLLAVPQSFLNLTDEF